MNLRDVVVAAREPNVVGFHQHIRMRQAWRRLEAIAGKLDQKAQGIGEIDGVHKAPVLHAAMPDVAIVQALDRLRKGGARDRKGDVVDAAGLGRSPPRIGFAVLVGENGDEPAVAGVEVKMAFLRPVEIGLLEHERHTEQPLPEIDRYLPGCSRERDVVDTLALELLHGVYRNSCTLKLLRAVPQRYRHLRIRSQCRTVPNSVLLGKVVVTYSLAGGCSR